MVTRHLLPTLIAFSMFASTSIANDQQKLQQSLATWQQLREDHGGNYSYTVRWSSFVGFGHQTDIVVRNNEVAARHYRTFSGRPALVEPGKPAPKPEGTSWVERGEELGTHKQGAPAKTLDELYTEAAEVLKRPLPEHERRYVRLDKQGLLLACFTVDTRIADDAPTKGVNISSIKLGAGDDAAKGDARRVHKAPNGKTFPAHWGAPPRAQTRDLRPLPGGYGRGSSTLARWIQTNLDRDGQREKRDG